MPDEIARWELYLARVWIVLGVATLPVWLPVWMAWACVWGVLEPAREVFGEVFCRANWNALRRHWRNGDGRYRG